MPLSTLNMFEKKQDVNLFIIIGIIIISISIIIVINIIKVFIRQYLNCHVRILTFCLCIAMECAE